MCFKGHDESKSLHFLKKKDKMTNFNQVFIHFTRYIEIAKTVTIVPFFRAWDCRSRLSFEQTGFRRRFMLTS